MDTATESLRADEAKGLAQQMLTVLQERIGPQKFKAWFRHGTRVEIEDGHVRVSVPNPFVANWIETHYQSDIADVAREQTGQTRPVVVTIDPTLTGELRKRQLDSQAQIVDKATHGRGRSRVAARPVPLRHSLADFVVGDSNRLAHSAAMAAVQAKTPPFNPLFIHGSCGVGKTHLLQGLCSAASRVRRDAGVATWRYVTAEQFTNEFISSMRARKLDEFRARYRKLSLLAIDDVHFLAAKKATQEEFLHTFNSIAGSGHQIVLASDAHPRLVGELTEQLVSRFVAGMVVKIESPDLTTRLEILRRHARKMKLKAPGEVLEFVAVHVRGSVRELEGSLIKLAALSALENGEVTLQMVSDALSDHLARTDSAITLGDIEAVTAAYFGITPADLHSTRRTKTVSAARMIAVFLARRHTRMSYPEIGRFMGKNHSSVVLAVQRMEALLAGGGEVVWSTPAGRRSMPAKKLIALLKENFG